VLKYLSKDTICPAPLKLAVLTVVSLVTVATDMGMSSDPLPECLRNDSLFGQIIAGNVNNLPFVFCFCFNLYF